MIPLLLLYKTKRDKNNERPEPNVEPPFVLPPSSGIGGGVDTFVPVKDAPPSKLTIDPPTVNSPQDRIDRKSVV